MRAAIIIVTRNRRDELARALRSCEIQQDAPEVLVIDDASDDGTGDMVRAEFPSVRYFREDVPRGCVVQRNRAASLTDAEILVSIDDDAEFSDPGVVAATLRDFEAVPGIAAVAIPYTEPPGHTDICQAAPDHERCWITAQFIGTAYAIRRDVFLELGGFNECLVHQGEERDFCLRLLAAGHHVRLGTAPPIRHHCSPARDRARMARHGRRNDIWFAWRHIPFPQVIARLVATTLAGFWHGLRHGETAATLRGILAGHAGILAGQAPRHPVPRNVYAHFRRLRRMPLRHVRGRCAAVRSP